MTVGAQVFLCHGSAGLDMSSGPHGTCAFVVFVFVTLLLAVLRYKWLFTKMNRITVIIFLASFVALACGLNLKAQKSEFLHLTDRSMAAEALLPLYVDFAQSFLAFCV